jgi:hypothetical protein
MKLKMALIVLAIVGISTVHADCPPATGIQGRNEVYAAQGLGGIWRVEKVFQVSGASLDELQNAKFVGVTIYDFQDPQSSYWSKVSVVSCSYLFANNRYFSLGSPKRHQYTPVMGTGTPSWDRFGGNPGVGYTCASSGNNVADCPFEGGY